MLTEYLVKWIGKVSIIYHPNQDAVKSERDAINNCPGQQVSHNHLGQSRAHHNLFTGDPPGSKSQAPTCGCDSDSRFRPSLSPGLLPDITARYFICAFKCYVSFLLIPWLTSGTSAQQTPGVNSFHHVSKEMRSSSLKTAEPHTLPHSPPAWTATWTPLSPRPAAGRTKLEPRTPWGGGARLTICSALLKTK